MATIRELKEQERRDAVNRPRGYTSVSQPQPAPQPIKTAPVRPENPYRLFHNGDLWFLYKMMQDQWYLYGVHFTDSNYHAFIRNYEMIESELKWRGMI